jgi:N-acetylglucosamine-6-phosphate deacetylase
MTIVAGGGLVAPGFDSDEPGWVEIAGSRIVAVGRGTRSTSRSLTLDDAVLVPGFVDIQVNGVDAIDFAHAGTSEWRDALVAQARHGVTGCCPTLVSAPLASYAQPLAVASSVADDVTVDLAVGANLLGIHLEGPFLGGAPGAHPVDCLRPVDLPWLHGILERVPGLVRVVTLAHEADPGFAGIRALREAGVVVAIGHSTATYDETRAATDAGASAVTHLFNGMGPFHHREPGVAGAALDDPRLTPSIIADLVHVHPAALRLAVRAKRSVALVTDAVAVGAGTIGDVVMQESSRSSRDQCATERRSARGCDHVARRDGAARLADGTLAGSILTMDRAVRNVVDLGFSLERAVELASTVPCEMLGLADRGVLEPGRRADIVALDRETLAVVAVWVGGKPVSRG